MNINSIYIYIYTFGSRPTFPSTDRPWVAGPAGQSRRYLDQLLQQPRPSVWPLHSFFMADSTQASLTVGPYGTRTRTQLRRQQRRHTQHCYLLLQSKLLALVKPMPAAINVQDLESFRANLFSMPSELVAEQSPESIEILQRKESHQPDINSLDANVCN